MGNTLMGLEDREDGLKVVLGKERQVRRVNRVFQEERMDREAFSYENHFGRRDDGEMESMGSDSETNFKNNKIRNLKK